MAVHEGQLSLLELADPADEQATAPPRPARQGATPRDTPSKSEARSRPRVSPKTPAGSAPGIGDAALLTTDEAAGLLHVHPRTVQRLVRRGELCAVHLGSAVRFDPHDVDGLIARLKRRMEGTPSPLGEPVRARRASSRASFSDRLRSRQHEHRAAQA
jgi:excisionase family DNA binding protein